MSTRVLVIPEDPTNNGYILKPLAEAVLAEAGRPAAKIQVLTNPRNRGYDSALRTIRGDLDSRYRHMDLWLFFPDGDLAAPEAMANLERDLGQKGVTLFCCPAVPEVEIYACAGFPSAEPGRWAEWRANSRLKETVFRDLLTQHGDPKTPGGGRRTMIEEALSRRGRFFGLCPEVAELRDRIAAHLAERAEESLR